MPMSKKFVLDVKENEEGELYIVLPDDVLDELGWVEGDELDYQYDESNESILITKVEE